MTILEYRAACAADEGALGELARSLEPSEPARRALESWGRLAASDPTGLRVWVALPAQAEPNQRLAAVVIARGVPARIDGQARVFAEVVAVAAHPRERQAARGARIAARLMEAYLAAHNTLAGDVITYGLAGDRDWRLLRHDLGIEVLRRQPELVRAVESGRPNGLPAGVRRLEAFPAGVLGLYERCSARWRASALRDEGSLNWRFPRGAESIRLALEGGDGTLEGYAVLGPGRPGRLELWDWLVPEQAPEVGDVLRQAILAEAQQGGFSEVAAALPPWCAEFGRFQASGYRVKPRRDFVLARSAHAKLDLWWLREHWWFQPFDTAWTGSAEALGQAATRPRRH
jgi:hypothetical protein